jgi:hypothetical protein
VPYKPGVSGGPSWRQAIPAATERVASIFASDERVLERLEINERGVSAKATLLTGSPDDPWDGQISQLTQPGPGGRIAADAPSIAAVHPPPTSCSGTASNIFGNA